MMRAEVECIVKIFHAEGKKIFFSYRKLDIFGNKISSLIRYHNFIDINENS